MNRVPVVLAAAALLALASAPPAVAQDGMALQRCVWRCLAASTGPEDPAYHRCVRKRCEAGASTRRPAAGEGTAEETPGARGGEGARVRWAFGDHPLFGRSAHVDAPGGSVALACDPGGIVALRISRDTFRDGPLTYMFERFGDTSTMPFPDGAYAERRDTSCAVSLDAFQRDHRMIVVDAAIGAISGREGETEIELEGEGGTVVVRSGPEALRKLGGRTIPLAGSSAAIGKMLAECPAARADIASDCGI